MLAHLKVATQALAAAGFSAQKKNSFFCEVPISNGNRIDVSHTCIQVQQQEFALLWHRKWAQILENLWNHKDTETTAIIFAFFPAQQPTNQKNITEHWLGRYANSKIPEFLMYDIQDVKRTIVQAWK